MSSVEAANRIATAERIFDSYAHLVGYSCENTDIKFEWGFSKTAALMAVDEVLGAIPADQKELIKFWRGVRVIIKSQKRKTN